jgi:hypothetical protein
MEDLFCYYIYAYVRQDGTPYYIGKGKGRRMRAPHKKNIAVPKDKRNIVVMESGLSEVGALALERRYIKWHGRKDLGTGILRNLTDGGEGQSGRVFTAEHKEKIRQSMLKSAFWAGKKMPPEARKKMSDGRIGMKLSDEHKDKIRQAMIGKVKSDETRLKLSIAHKGKPNKRKGVKVSDETKRRMSEARKGEKSHMFGKPHSTETKAKMSASMLGKKQNVMVCPHCNKSGGSIMRRWHFENCKFFKE